MKKIRKSIVIPIVIILIMILLNIIARCSNAFSDFYVEYIFPYIMTCFSFITGLFPFSVGELLIKNRHNCCYFRNTLIYNSYDFQKKVTKKDRNCILYSSFMDFDIHIINGNNKLLYNVSVYEVFGEIFQCGTA